VAPVGDGRHHPAEVHFISRKQAMRDRNVSGLPMVARAGSAFFDADLVSADCG
jgi:hypothetical protein